MKLAFQHNAEVNFKEVAGGYAYRGHLLSAEARARILKLRKAMDWLFLLLIGGVSGLSRFSTLGLFFVVNGAIVGLMTIVYFLERGVVEEAPETDERIDPAEQERQALAQYTPGKMILGLIVVAVFSAMTVIAWIIAIDEPRPRMLAAAILGTLLCPYLAWYVGRSILRKRKLDRMGR